MKQRMFRLLTLVLILCLAPLSLTAATVSVADEILNLKQYYTNTTELSHWEEVLVFASLGMLSERIQATVSQDDSAEGLAIRILTAAARGNETDDADLTRLAALQDDNGAFGTVDVHCLSMLALRAKNVLYNSAKAYRWLTEQQNEDGSFGTTAKETALAITVLSLSENDTETEAKNTAAKYLARYNAESEQDLCWQIIGITDAGFDANTTEERDLTAKLLTYQNPSDFSYSDTYDTTKGQALPTALALTALDTVNRSASPCKRLAQNGNLNRYSLSDFRPLLIFGGAALGLSILFWIYIFAHKKNQKTLEETKIY